MSVFRIAPVALVSIALTACNTTQTQMPAFSSTAVETEALKQRAMAFERDERMMVRLLSVANPILKANTELCDGRVKHDFGFRVADRSEFVKDFRDGFAERYGAGKRPRITIVSRDTPAFNAGLVRGHEILAVNGEETKDSRNSADKLRKKIEKAEDEQTPLVLTVAKDGIRRDVTLEGELICDFGVLIEEADFINAFADGKNIIFTVGMMRFAETDEELATVVGHEIAHNVMDHRQAATTGALLGGLLGVLVDSAAASQGASTGGFYGDLGAGLGARAFSVEREQEADYVGLYLMERGGFDSSDVANFWRRMGAENPGAIERSGVPFMDTHPAAPERYIALQAIHSEIMEKRASGTPLVPNMKE